MADLRYRVELWEDRHPQPDAVVDITSDYPVDPDQAMQLAMQETDLTYAAMGAVTDYNTGLPRGDLSLRWDAAFVDGIYTYDEGA